MVESARMPQVWIYVVAMTVLKLCGTEEVIADPDPSLCNEIGTGAPVVFIQGVREDITNGSVIDYVNLTGTPQQIDLRIKTPSEYLDFNSATRAIILKKPVDLDNSTNVPSIYIVLDCVVKGAQVLNIPVRVTVIVTDINDNAPIFLKPIYTVEISELTPVGTTIVTDILATDADKDNSFIEYSILPGPNSTYFDIPIPAQGKVTLNRSLDYDRGQRAMTVVIMAKDHPANGDPQFNTTVLLKVNITDGDDQNPKFLHPVYEGTVLENATRNTQVHMFTPIFAIDQDTGINTGVLYTIERSDSTDTGDSSYFYIDHRTGNIFVQKDTLFRGREFFFQVKATQQDNPDRNALAGVKIRVQASNVNPPKFLKDTYFATLVENVPIGTSVLTVSAKDMDFDGSQPQGSYLRYSLRPGKGSDRFQIGEQKPIQHC
ncbi:cadherin-89D-like [Lingula anatina]|uniref:Cadherin-89D-like n=1 Tax=Lingula anatina TaxID=7574 RepID=A0A1S3JAG6_LINAN|nr:cadherin-89D-like [Lingula anatina]|eukprot:XP_013406874.1 cadherin-89D-like [Lingula anatina]